MILDLCNIPVSLHVAASVEPIEKEDCIEKMTKSGKWTMRLNNYGAINYYVLHYMNVMMPLL